MCPDDQTDSSRRAHGDEPFPGSPRGPARDAIRSVTPDPTGVTPDAPESLQAIAAILAVHGIGTSERVLAEPSDTLITTLSQERPSPAPGAPTVPG
jgi:hypothetical protein